MTPSATRGSQYMQYLFQDPVRILQYIIVPEPQHGVTACLQRAGARLILGGPLRMLTAVQFDNQTSARTEEVCNMPTHWSLPPEFISFKSPSTKMMPEPNFGIRTVLTQGSRKICQRFSGHEAFYKRERRFSNHYPSEFEPLARWPEYSSSPLGEDSETWRLCRLVAAGEGL
ncbi:hypothetical protein HNQ99_002057 [Rhizorhapis suberifaciens]|uniref:Uncharacterized protein n=1 Tax=Rhizorhapis suberifaciens TaxID=13656 RepID=A0A840HWF4_9SPHN|nr:hypothetical protein [Rhizorhapis suberifaciens]